MAIYRFELKHVTRTRGLSAKAHANYITRNDAPITERQQEHDEKERELSASGHAQYLDRSIPPSRQDRSEDLEYVQHGNMPVWAQEKPQKFWDAADKFERTNGRLYSEMLVSLPRELSKDERIELTREFVAKELGERQPYSLAIHNSTALDGGEQPHAHIMFSERARDGIERGPVHFFKRADSQRPELGGNAKDRTWHSRERVLELRQSWERSANAALERAGLDVRVDHRSLEARDIDRLPEPKLGRDQTAMLRNGNPSERGATIIELREYREHVATLEKKLEKTEQEISLLADRKARQIARGRELVANVQNFDERAALLRLGDRENVQIARELTALDQSNDLTHTLAKPGYVEGRVHDRVTVGKEHYARVQTGEDAMTLVPWDKKLEHNLGKTMRFLVASQDHPVRSRLRLVRIIDRERDRADSFGLGFG